MSQKVMPDQFLDDLMKSFRP